MFKNIISKTALALGLVVSLIGAQPVHANSFQDTQLSADCDSFTIFVQGILVPGQTGFSVQYDLTVNEDGNVSQVTGNFPVDNNNGNFVKTISFNWTTPPQGNTTVSGTVTLIRNDGSGEVIDDTTSFYNQLVSFVCDVDGGGEGCTPGYWKQTQHFGNWTAPYTPSTPFSDVFENAFGDQTLLEVLNNGGGGLAALGRHAVAALLNGASAGVDYDYSTGVVINLFNTTYPGTKADYNNLKDLFVGFNEQGCPLDRAE